MKIFNRKKQKQKNMWNGKCNPGKEPPPGSMQNQNDLNIRNGPATDTSSIRSVSSEDISTSDLPTACCSSNATNPAIKSGRRFQLLQVCCNFYRAPPYHPLSSNTFDWVWFVGFVFLIYAYRIWEFGNSGNGFLSFSNHRSSTQFSRFEFAE